MSTIEGFRLSPQQRRLWLLQQSVAGAPFRARCALEIKGDLEIRRLTAAIETVLSKREILSTVFRSLPGMRLPVQIIAERDTSSIDYEDLIQAGVSEMNGQLEALLGRAAERPFNFEMGPLVYISVVRLSSQRHVLSFDISSLCSDRATLKNFAYEVGIVYESLVSGRPAPALDEEMAYADYAQWQCDILESDETAWGKRLWRRKNLAGRLNYELWREQRLSGHSSFNPRLYRHVVGPRIRDKIEAIAHECDVSSDILMLAVWSVLLGRFTWRSNLIVGCACDSRNYAELERAYGLLAKYLPIEYDLDGWPSFIDLLGRIKESFREAAEWQECFDWAQLANARDRQEPFCSFGFDFESLPATARFAEVSFSFRDLDACIDRFDLRLSCLQSDDSLLANLHYDASRYREEEIERLMECYSLLLEGAIENPAGSIDDLPIVSPREQRKLLLDFNRTQSEFDTNQCIHRMIEKQAICNPDGLAVVCGRQQLSYKELNARANFIAYRLRELDVKPEEIIGVCLDQSTEMIVAIFGVLKAGGGYLPLDPAYPAERLIMMIRDAQAPIVICSSRTKAILNGSRGAQSEAPRLICVEEFLDGWMGDFENPADGLWDQGVAYMIYTSGSTGRPKGVIVTHENLARSTRTRLGYYREPVSSFLLLSSFSFDSSVAGIFGTLCQGGTLFIPDGEGRDDAAQIAQLIGRSYITHMLSLPSLYSNIIDQARAGQLSSLRAVILAGEATTKELVDQHYRLIPGTQLFNEYGPTEATVWSAVHECHPDESERVPIGRPITNVRSLVFNPRLRLLPVGAPGEIHIGGDGVTRGYLNRPEVTAEKFIPDPVAISPGDRLYKTGDLARFLTDGTLEFLGRLDYQVKIRGVRIEPGEIEATLRQDPRLREAIVMARERHSGEKLLVAYIVPATEHVHSTHELRRFLEEKLPSFLIPSAFVRLKSLPLTSNGKIDRLALPEPDWSNPERENCLVAPRNAVEEILAGIWGEVLEIDRVGIHDSFFAVGGHSLNATRVMSRVNKVFRVELSIRHLFEAPTVAALAGRIMVAMNTEANGRGSAIQRAVGVERIPLSLAQERLWFLSQLEPDSPGYNVPGAFSIDGLLNLPALEQSFQEITRRHEILRTTFAIVDGHAEQVIAAAATWIISLVDLQGIPQVEHMAVVSELAIAEARRPFDLARGPLLRASLLRLGPESHVTLFTTHHIISDGWSMGILIRELKELCGQAFVGAPSGLPELPIQYKDFALWQRDQLQGESLKSHLDYWESRLDNLSPFELPSDYSRPAIQSFSGAVKSFELTDTLTERLRVLSRRQGVTLYMTLLAAFEILLHWYSGRPDIAVGTSVANRNHLDTEGLIGFFVNTLIIRMDLSQSSTFRELLEQAREVCLDAFAHQDLPLTKLVERLRPERSMSQQPLFQILFDLNNASSERLESLPFRLTPLRVDRMVARFDLALILREGSHGLEGVIEYCTDLFRPATIDRLLKHYRAILEGVVTNIDYSISAQDLISDEVRERLAIAFNANLESGG